MHKTVTLQLLVISLDQRHVSYQRQLRESLLTLFWLIFLLFLPLLLFFFLLCFNWLWLYSLFFCLFVWFFLMFLLMLLSFLRKKSRKQKDTESNRCNTEKQREQKQTDEKKYTNSFHDFLGLINIPFTNNGPNLSKFSTQKRTKT